MLSSYVLDQAWIYRDGSPTDPLRRTARARHKPQFRPPQDGSGNFLALIFEECQHSFKMVNAARFPGMPGIYSWNVRQEVPVSPMRFRQSAPRLRSRTRVLSGAVSRPSYVLLVP